MRFGSFALLLLTTTTLACGGMTYMPSRVARFDPEGSLEVNDDDVKKAFEAKPQLGDQFNVAYFSFDPSKNADIETALHAVPGVGTVYAIPALAATGARRFEEAPPAWASVPAQPLSIKKLRLLAARAHCDVVVVVDYGYRTDAWANALSALNVFVLPSLFVPFREISAQSYVDAFVIDTRNGYLYGQTSSTQEGKKSYQTIYATSDDLVASQWTTLKGDLQSALVKLAEAERAKAVAK